MFRLILLGPPGAGKGTQARLLGERFGIPHVSTGNIFRENISKGTDLGKQVERFLKEGNLVPDNLTNELVKERLLRRDCAPGFVLDGYPRTLGQAQYVKRVARITAAIEIAVSEEEVVKRLGSRWMCKCGQVYNLLSSPPRKAKQCDACGGALYQRDDDKPDVIRHRFKVYREQTAPLIGFYRKERKYLKVDGRGGIEEIAQRVSQVLLKQVSHTSISR